MPTLYRPLLMLVVCVALMSKAMAQSTTIGVETLLDRAPDNLSEPKDTKFQVNGEHAFANGVALGGSFEPEITTSGVWTYNLEGTLGYGFKLTDRISLGGSAGVGERFEPASSGGDFPYYVLRVRADIDLSERWSWNVITYRYRDAFNTANSYNTPQLSTAITLKIDNRSSVYTKYFYDWQEGSPNAQGFGFGYKYHF
jgi:hypothetical protein